MFSSAQLKGSNCLLGKLAATAFWLCTAVLHVILDHKKIVQKTPCDKSICKRDRFSVLNWSTEVILLSATWSCESRQPDTTSSGCKLHNFWNKTHCFGIFSHLKLCLPHVIHKFEYVKIIQIWQNGVQRFICLSVYLIDGTKIIKNTIPHISTFICADDDLKANRLWAWWDL